MAIQDSLSALMVSMPFSLQDILRCVSEGF